MVIIEVKQYSLNADAQVLNQVESIERNIKAAVGDSDVSVIRDVIRITWQDMIRIIQDVERLHEGRSDFVLNHYLEYLKTHRQWWFPIEPFRAGMTDAMMWKRIWPLVNNCVNLLGENTDSVGETPSNYRIFLKNSSWGYMQEIQIGLSNNDINIMLWPANTCKQSWSLFANHNKVRNDMSWVDAGKIRINDNTELSIDTKFYLKLSDSYGRYVMNICPPKHILGTDRAAICEKFCNPLNGKKRRESWNDLKRFLEENGLLESPEEFTADFNEKFEESNMTCLIVSVGFEITINLPLKLLEECDKRNGKFMDSPENDAAAKIIVSALSELKNMIEE